MEFKYPALRRAVLKTAAPVMAWVGRIHLPLGRAVNEEMVFEMGHLLVPGDVLLTYARGHLTNLVIPGEWKHAAMYAGRDHVIEALGKGVKRTEFSDFCVSKDRILALRPTFCSAEMAAQSLVYAETLIGSEYDYLVEYNIDTRINKAFYCSEIPWWAYNRAMIAAGQKSPFTPRQTFGVDTITPQDYALARSKWAVIGQWGRAIPI